MKDTEFGSREGTFLHLHPRFLSNFLFFFIILSRRGCSWIKFDEPPFVPCAPGHLSRMFWKCI